MTVDERRLPSVLTDLYLGPTPDYRDDLLARAARTRQRPGWSFPGRWLPMAEITSHTAVSPRLPWRAIALALVVITLLIVGALAFAGSRQPKLPSPFGVAGNGLIAFAQNGDIMTLDPATAASRVLVAGPEQDSAPVYSSDGTKIVFERVLAPGALALFVANADGSSVVRVTPDPIANVLARTFSPDGRSILVTAWMGDRAQAFEVASDGSRPPKTLDVQLPTDMGSVEAPAYRPTDGSQVLVTEWLPGTSSRSLTLVDLTAGTTRTVVWPSNTLDIFGANWSPNGEWISYAQFDPSSDTVTARVHVMAADGTGDRLLDSIPGTRHDSGFAWSNDSTRMIVDRGYAGDFSNDRIAVVSIDGSHRSVELDCPSLGGGTCGDSWSWSPDDASLLGIISADGPSPRFVMADPTTGRVSEMPWPGGSSSSWQRVGS